MFSTAPVSPDVCGQNYEFSYDQSKPFTSAEPADSNPIKFAQLIGKQEIRLKFNDSENVNDAKVR